MGFTWAPSSGDVYQEVSGTVTFNDDDVQWVYVDWDDGQDNSLEYAIYQWDRLKTDSNTITLNHTYTKAGTFYPVVRTINSQGFISKYLYDNGMTATTVPKPKESVTDISPITISDTSPTSVIRIENKQVLSGIDNNIFEEGSKDLYLMIAPLIVSSSALIAPPGPYNFSIDITAVVELNTHYDVPNTEADYYGGEKVIRTITALFDYNASTPDAPAAVPVGLEQGARISKVLEVKLNNPKLIATTLYTNSVINEFNKTKIFLIAKGNDDLWYPITYITNGDPIKSIDDVKRTVTLDYSQSRAAASNKSISYYKYDSGKVWFEPSLQWQASSSTKLNDNTKVTDSLITKNYTYYTEPNGLLEGTYSGAEHVTAIVSGNAFSYGTTVNKTYAKVRDQFALNTFNQFYDQYHLTRLESVSNTTKYSGLDTFTNVYRIRPTLVTTGATGYYITPPSPAADETSIHTSGAYLNASGNAINCTNWNVGPFMLQDGSTPRDASEYFMVTNDTKFNKIFINATTYAPNIESDLVGVSGATVAGVYYLRVYNEKAGNFLTQNAEWVPLKFEDTTMVEKEYRNTVESEYQTKATSMSRSGFIKFDMPSDWANVTASGLAGGFYDSSTATYNTDNKYSELFTGVKRASFTTPGFDNYVVEGTFATTTMNANDIGQYKYIFEVSSPTTETNDHKKVFWIASGNAAGTKLFLASGATSTMASSVGGTVAGYVRRINFYDVFDGSSRTSNIGLPPEYTNGGSNYPYQWMVGNQTAFINELKNNFSGYPLKIVVSGATDNFISGTAQPGMQLWNMFPYDNAASQVVVQKDNTAYDLTYLEITSDVSVSYAGTYYQAITKNGKVFVTRTGTPIQTIGFGGTAMGDETQFKYNEEFTSYGTLRLLKRMQSESIRVMWDEVQKDGTYVRFFGYVSDIAESHSNQGPRAPKPFSFNMIIEEICLINSTGYLMSGVIPLGGVKDATNFK
jgi:hypothetical protein